MDRQASGCGWFGRGCAVLTMGAAVLGLLMAAGCDSKTTASTSTPPQPAQAQSAAAEPAAPAAPVAPIALASQPQTPAEPAAEVVTVLPLVAEPASFELGFVTGNEIKTSTIQLRNLSDKPLTIKRVRPSCTCTTLGDYAGKVIPPRGELPVTARYEASEDTGPKSSYVWVTLEGFPDDSMLTIPLKAEVAVAIHAIPGYLRGEDTAMGSGQIKIESIDKEPFRILATDGQEPVYLDGFKPGDAPRNSYLVKWDLSSRLNTCVNIPWWWVVETDHPKCPLLDVRIRHSCTKVSSFALNGRKEIFVLPKNQWRIASLRALVNPIEPGKTGRVRFSAENIGALELVSGVPLMGPIKSVSVLGSEWKEGVKYFDVAVTPYPDHRGLYFGVVEFTANDGTKSPVWLIGTVREAPKP